MHTDLHAPWTCDRKGLHARVDSTDMDQQKLADILHRILRKRKGRLAGVISVLEEAADVVDASASDDDPDAECSCKFI